MKRTTIFSINIFFIFFILNHQETHCKSDDKNNLNNVNEKNRFDYIQHASEILESSNNRTIQNKRLKSDEQDRKSIENVNSINELDNQGRTTSKIKSQKINLRKKRKVINEIDSKTHLPTRWPNATIPYEFDNYFPNYTKPKVYEAMKHWEKYTCLRFQPYDPVLHRYYTSKLHFQPGAICGSYVGYSKNPMFDTVRVPLYLGDNCGLGNVIHEIGHVIGFRHEQSRVDRDDHVKIHFEKLSEDIAAQYDKMEDSQPGYYGVKYDLFSIMHYGTGEGVIESLDSNRNFLMGQRVGLSFLDIELANKAYQCAKDCPITFVCYNGGFLVKGCKCVCPDAITGRFCETIMPNAHNGNMKISLDDLSNDPNLLNCDFTNETFCNWSNDDIRSVQSWIFNDPINSGFTMGQTYFQLEEPNLKMGPQSGDFIGNINGRYAYLNSFLKTIPSTNSVLSSPIIKVANLDLVCLKFWYNMYQSVNYTRFPLRVGNLSVNLRHSNGQIEQVWFREGNQGINWQLASVNLELKPPETEIFFEAYLKDYNYGDIAIDNIQIKKGSCFEIKLSNWTDWSSCLGKCQQGLQSRYRYCVDDNNKIIECKYFQSQSRYCDLESCVYPHFSEWSSWSSCIGNCDASYQIRTRQCINKEKGPCVGAENEFRKCPSTCLAGHKRLMIGSESFPNNKDGNSTEKWNDWSECSKSCGLGQQIRYVKCLEIDEYTCDPRKHEIRNCLVKLCEEDIWGGWSNWSDCQEKELCKPGVQYRHRLCNGEFCIGVPTESKECSLNRSVDIENFCNSETLPISYGCELNIDSYSSLTNSCIIINSNLTKNVSPQTKTNSKNETFEMKSLGQHEKLASFQFDSINLNSGSKILFKISAKLEANLSLTSDDFNYCFQIYFKTKQLFDNKQDNISISYFDSKQDDIVKLNKISHEYYSKDDLIAFRTNISINELTPYLNIYVELNLNSNVSDREEITYFIKSLFLQKGFCKLAEHHSRTRRDVIQQKLINFDNVDVSLESSPLKPMDESVDCGEQHQLGFNQKITITSPNYPNQYNKNIRCNYLIKSPEGARLKIKILDLDLENYPKFNSCIDGIELRYYHLGQPGPIFCGTITNTSNFNITTYFNYLMVVFRSDWGQTQTRRGFKLEASTTT